MERLLNRSGITPDSRSATIVTSAVKVNFRHYRESIRAQLKTMKTTVHTGQVRLCDHLHQTPFFILRPSGLLTPVTRELPRSLLWEKTPSLCFVKAG
jgi:hypothetical protein